MSGLAINIEGIDFKGINLSIPKIENRNILPNITLPKKAKTKVVDDSLMTKEEYFAMIDKAKQRVSEGKVYKLTAELEKELFSSIL